MEFIHFVLLLLSVFTFPSFAAPSNRILAARQASDSAADALSLASSWLTGLQSTEPANAQKSGTPSYLVVQLDNDNPGIWPFHCHVAWHVSQGFYINLLEHPHRIKQDMDIPLDDFAETCNDWSAWTIGHWPHQIDSGL